MQQPLVNSYGDL